MKNALTAKHMGMARACVRVLLIGSLLAIPASCAWAQDHTNGYVVIEPALDEPGFIMQIIGNLLNSRALLATLSKPELTLAAFITLNVIVFVETGLLIGFFLPGDSLLVTAGVASYLAGWNLPLLLASLCVSAIVGDSVGYAIGWKTGPMIFNREKSWFFNREHLFKAHAFYEKHGGKTIVLARFMPIIRTFAPVVAGVGEMNYRKFLLFNVAGGIGWVVSMVMIGFSLSTIINPAFRYLLGNAQFEVQDHIEKVVILVVLLSISPGIYVWFRSRIKKNGPRPPVGMQPELVNAK